MTGNASIIDSAAPHVESFLSSLPKEAVKLADWNVPLLPRQNEALTVPTQVRTTHTHTHTHRHTPAVTKEAASSFWQPCSLLRLTVKLVLSFVLLEHKRGDNKSCVCVRVFTQVNYVVKSGNLYEDAGYQLSGSSYVVDKLLGTTHLWEKVSPMLRAHTDTHTHTHTHTHFSLLLPYTH